jgi:regulator of CtrA degradation
MNSIRSKKNNVVLKRHRKDLRIMSQTSDIIEENISTSSETTVNFGKKLMGSESFKSLFREGMGLVEETAAYLDGDGRQESRLLIRAVALAYATESMRLTTRLMQMASWLLIQRASNEGEMTPDQAMEEKRKVRLSTSRTAVPNDVFMGLPERLRNLIARTERLQERILLLDSHISGPSDMDVIENPIRSQLALIHTAFGIH